MIIQEPSFIETSTLLPDHDGIGEVSLPLLGASEDGNQFWASGTAVVVAPWFAMTARHVVEDYVDRFGGTSIPSPDGASTIAANITPKFQLLTYLALQGGRGLISLRVGRMWFTQPMDIAFLELIPGSRESPKDHNWKCPVLDLSPPLIGTSISVMGYPNSHIVRKSDLEPSLWNMQPRTSTGSVLEIHQERRDRVLLPFPSFRTNARFDGGMSGAPVFNSAGNVCGLVCSGMPPMNEEGEHVSYASLLWPAMGIPICLPWRYPDGRSYWLTSLLPQA